MSVYTEKEFEDEICAHLSGNRWLYNKGDAQNYDRELALYPPDLIAWVQKAFPKAWELLEKNHGSETKDVLLKRVRSQLNKVGTLDVLRHGVGIRDLPNDLKLAQFKNSYGAEVEIRRLYQLNQLRVVRQVEYSVHSKLCIDLVLFLNGIPVATVELKTDNTQNAQAAVDQYKETRNPKPRGKSSEPLLTFPSGALIHFAVSNSEVQMSTKLEGFKTVFLPFNRGSNPGGKDCGRGNPLMEGHQTSYLWEEVWERESWLEILGRYFTTERNKKNQISKVIFPRYHQLRVTRRLQKAVLEEGPGKKYLIQHSAGSGKTNSIAWTAHFFAELHNNEHEKVFDAVLVISDRNVIDSQLQEALKSFERSQDVVASVTTKGGCKSESLAKALSGKKKIVVCTIQTFPFAFEAVLKRAATKGKTFAVIADEAHSSQTGVAAAKLKQVLSTSELKELKDGGEVSIDEVLSAEMSDRAKESGITYVAFTATPKAKTLEIFGRRPDPQEEAWEGNLPEPFDVYSMRQAIEEGFILDVLKNYTNYETLFRLAYGDENISDEEVDRSTANKKLIGWVKLHPHNIAKKAEVVIEHFKNSVWPLLGGKAKAMIVVATRKEAVRWKMAIDNYINNKGYPIGTLVAFSGEVKDKKSGPDPFTEKCQSMNPGLKGDIREAFKRDDRQILLVANKFQTGFDQPLLCGMYVNRRLDGIQAVQTLSRLNRCYKDKTTTYVLDFVNKPNDILASFKAYYTTAELEGVTDPNLILDLRVKLDAQCHYDNHEIDKVVGILLDKNSKQSQFQGAIVPIAQRLLNLYKQARQDFKQAKGINDSGAQKDARDELESLIMFRSDMNTYVRFYSYLSQIYEYKNTGLEKRAMFFKRLLPLMEFEREISTIDLSKVVLTHHHLKDFGLHELNLDEGENNPIPTPEPGGGGVKDEEKVLLSEIIEKLNELFSGELTDGDKVAYVGTVIKGKLLESRTLQKQARKISKEELRRSPDLLLTSQDAYIDALEAHSLMSRQAIDNIYIQQNIINLLIDKFDLWEDLRRQPQVSRK